MKLSPDTVKTLLQARRAGRTLREAAAEAGVHIATACQWQARLPELRQALRDAVWAARDRRLERPRRAWVPTQPDCP